MNNRDFPISEAFVFNLNNENHTHTSSSGQFSLKGSLGDSIQISHVGYETTTFIAGENSKSIILQEKLNLISEVVITPGINSLELFSTINSSINPVTSSQDLLRKVPGLIIGQHAGGTSGDFFRAANLNIYIERCFRVLFFSAL